VRPARGIGSWRHAEVTTSVERPTTRFVAGSFMGPAQGRHLAGVPAHRHESAFLAGLNHPGNGTHPVRRLCLQGTPRRSGSRTHDLGGRSGVGRNSLAVREVYRAWRRSRIAGACPGGRAAVHPLTGVGIPLGLPDRTRQLLGACGDPLPLPEDAELRRSRAPVRSESTAPARAGGALMVSRVKRLNRCHRDCIRRLDAILTGMNSLRAGLRRTDLRSNVLVLSVIGVSLSRSAAAVSIFR
jgi:hypothetical protein